MKKPVLVVLAAGMGSRYGGLKQIDPVGPNGEVIIDYSLYDAKKAGFEKVVFIIKHEIEKDFKEVIGNRMEKNMQVAYAYQQLDKLPAGFSVPEGREKPFGTSHALLCAKGEIDGPFAVINADDYYGPAAYRTLYDFFAQNHGGGKNHYAMVGYHVENTVTEHGSVTRGVCKADHGGFLTEIVETSGIEKTPEGARAPGEGEHTWVQLAKGTLVSMNFWGFDESFLRALEEGFPAFLREELPKNPMKAEYLLPASVDREIRKGAADVKVLSSSDRWWGVTYKEDKPGVMAALAEKHAQGQYPTPLW
ncbi:NTP transferase domain-containing protein [Ruminococcaceae bacterium OttesenSCG-928-I18]|nr:NTP transferase domain-containing protein [Ruminococcaceae bacterium OttesenSCG-928-I18]